MRLKDGQYKFRVRTTSLASTSAFTKELYINVDTRAFSVAKLLLFIGIFIIIIAVGFVIVRLYLHVRPNVRFGNRAISQQDLLAMGEPPARDDRPDADRLSFELQRRSIDRSSLDLDRSFERNGASIDRDRVSVDRLSAARDPLSVERDAVPNLRERASAQRERASAQRDRSVDLDRSFGTDRSSPNEDRLFEEVFY